MENSDHILINHAYCITLSMQAYAKITGMQAENQQRAVQGLSPAYVEKDFLSVIDDCQQHHNGVLTNMNQNIY